MNELEKYLNNVQRFGIQPGLERIVSLLDLAGKPQLQYPVVLVGGTNGKGSTCEFLARMLAGTRGPTALYTSPHLYRWNERLRVLNSRMINQAGDLFPGAISDDELDRLFHDALPYLSQVAGEQSQPTEFETLTFLAFWHFARAEVKSAVIEVGLGGRWDATNVADPQVSVVTHVALDHCDRLGNTVEEIASDKIDIARPGRIVVTAETKPNVLEVFRDGCHARGARLWPFRAPEFADEAGEMERYRETIENALAQSGISNPYQLINFRTAAFARMALEQTLTGPPASLDSSWLRLARNDQTGVVPGRMEVVRAEPTVILDSANNPDGAAHLAQFLKTKLAASPEARLILVAGILADKDYTGMLSVLAPLATTVIATQSPSARATPVEELAAAAKRYAQHIESVTPVMEAVRRAMQIAEAGDIVCIAGSFYTIAEVDRDELQKL